MASSRALRVRSLGLVLCSTSTVLATGCLEDNPIEPTATAGTEDPTAGTSDTTTAGAEDGLLACASPPCTLLVVSQTLDDRIDVYDVTAAPFLRGRIGTDLKFDASGEQVMGNLLDEPYGLLLDGDHLWAAIGHYPDTNRGSLLAFPHAAFADVAQGEVFAEDKYFGAGKFSAGVLDLPFGRQEAIFLLRHPSGKILVGVFANDLRAASWPEPSELLVVDPTDLRSEAIGAFSLDLDTTPCNGGWKIAALDDAVSRVAFACDGNDAVAVISLPGDFAELAPAAAAAGMSACSTPLASGTVTTQFVAPDGAGGLLAVQSQILEPPKLWSINGNCGIAGAPGDELPPELDSVRVVREPVLLRPAGGGQPAMWLLASETPTPGVLIVRGGASPTVCGQVSGLDAIEAAENAPFALTLDSTRTHLAIGAGPVSNPPFAEGRGQVLWATLDVAELDSCAVAATDVVDLTEGTFVATDPRTWVRAPNMLLIAELGGS
ncbi:hypothetical protein OV203_14425 [Nannocystis sp. ILAH1]|uniref:hypothetical protein n=1 Tax=Nannocystis sp. ILAH1 TaxID=2996789 RepID=UPI00227198AE|nr:hypothetical protein [Nannocystis sp. ILAH1]MCY0988324.1 hypothetical protein [Nannocystis sp. ILAH1]